MPGVTLFALVAAAALVALGDRRERAPVAEPVRTAPAARTPARSTRAWRCERPDRRARRARAHGRRRRRRSPGCSCARSGCGRTASGRWPRRPADTAGRRPAPREDSSARGDSPRTPRRGWTRRSCCCRVGQYRRAVGLLDRSCATTPARSAGGRCSPAATVGTDPRRNDRRPRASSSPSTGACRARRGAAPRSCERPTAALPVIPGRVQGSSTRDVLSPRRPHPRMGRDASARRAAGAGRRRAAGASSGASPRPLARPDLARRFGAASRRPGFTIRLPRTSVERRGRVDVQVYGGRWRGGKRARVVLQGTKLAFGC